MSPVYVSAGDDKKFEPAPEGLWPMVCCDVIDKGLVATQWGPKQKVQIRWQLGEEAGLREDGKPWLVSKTFNASLFKLAELSKCLVRWRGKQFTDDELKKFDLETVIGVAGFGNIVHNTMDDGTVFANVDTVMPLPKTMKAPTIKDYTRQKDRATDGVDVAAVRESLTTTPKPEGPSAPSQPHDSGNAELAAELWPEEDGAAENQQVTAQVLVALRGLGYPDPQFQLDAICRQKGKLWAKVSLADKRATLKTLEAKLKANLDAVAAAQQ